MNMKRIDSVYSDFYMTKVAVASGVCILQVELVVFHTAL